MSNCAVPAGEIAGFVLAGGQSSRMGRDKALVEVHGRTLVAGAVEKLRSVGLSAAIAGARSELGDIAPVIADEHSGEGPLGGICSALASTKAEFAVFLPVDLPLLPPSLLACLESHAQTTGAPVTLTSLNGFAQTFPVVLRTFLRPLLSRELEAGRRGCFAAFRTAAGELGEPLRLIPVELLAQAGQVRDEAALPPYRWFLNVNTPQDVERAAAHRVS